MPLSEQFGYIRFESGHLQPEIGSVVSEALVRLHVNGQELATMMCSPHELDVLALGFLANEGIIDGRADVRLVKVCPSLACVEVWLRDASRELPTHGIITSGCGGGITFADLTAGIEPLASELRVTPRRSAGCSAPCSPDRRPEGFIPRRWPRVNRCWLLSRTSAGTIQ